MATLTCHSSRGGGELWLGSLRDALDKKFLRREDIAGVFSILQPNEMYRERQKHIYKAYRIRHWKYPIFDAPNQAIDFKSVNLSKINGFLQSGQSVLIYSRHGAGRAATIVLVRERSRWYAGISGDLQEHAARKSHSASSTTETAG